MMTDRSTAVHGLALTGVLAAAWDGLHPLFDHPFIAAPTVSASARVSGMEVTR
ncbi:hypothetical protein EES39_38625 [Streptomyces sp. ADI92-24]|uniref:hypothetical protein n=1 Tax=Streptomyces sp. ADI92-24 TaxID=1522756 RepID=UPI000F976AD7|nr:hypothetical protein [Streptomyces sp. ADI92-24]RPK32405.1 hypothetical protein EES39_38625 [Streptomyces sp. ADI92-24]